MSKTIKILGMVLLAGAAITSCTNDDDVTNWDDTYLSRNGIISFKAESTPQTRAGEATANTLSSFNVAVFDNTSRSTLLDRETFTYDTDAAVFKSATDYYWPVSGTVNINAIANGDRSNFTSVPAADATLLSFYKYVNTSATTDLQAASAISAEKQSPYPLTFKHILSKVKVKVQAAETTQLDYQLSSIKMTMPKTGTYTFPTEADSDGSWSISSDTQAKTFSSAYVNETSQQSFPYKMTNTQSVWTDWCYILPTTTEPIIFEVEYKVYKGSLLVGDFTGNAAKTVTVAKPSLEMGKECTYVLSIPSGATSMSFSKTETDWISNISTINGHKFVDLGLPSGTLWAQCNVGATEEAEVGGLYAWGETSVQSPKTYSASTYKYTESVTGTGGNQVVTYSKYNTTDGKRTLDATDDAATVNWGSPCRMPTSTEIQELMDNCEVKEATRILSSGKTVTAIEFVSKINGESIFCRSGLRINGNYIFYMDPEEYTYVAIWSKSLADDGEAYAMTVMGGSLASEAGSGYRYCGMSIRPVASK